MKNTTLHQELVAAASPISQEKFALYVECFRDNFECSAVLVLQTQDNGIRINGLKGNEYAVASTLLLLQEDPFGPKVLMAAPLEKTPNFSGSADQPNIDETYLEAMKEQKLKFVEADPDFKVFIGAEIRFEFEADTMLTTMAETRATIMRANENARAEEEFRRRLKENPELGIRVA